MASGYSVTALASSNMGSIVIHGIFSMIGTHFARVVVVKFVVRLEIFVGE